MRKFKVEYLLEKHGSLCEFLMEVYPKENWKPWKFLYEKPSEKMVVTRGKNGGKIKLIV